MFVDDMGIELAKRGGLIDKLPRKQIRGLGRRPDRCSYNDGCGVEFPMSGAGPAYYSETGTPLATYGDLWNPRLHGRFPMYPPKGTQSL